LHAVSDNSAQDRFCSILAGTSVDAVLQLTGLDRQEARILVMHALHLSRAQLITQSNRSLTTDEAQHISQLFERRIAGEPIAYIVGEREFYGLSFIVTPDVLIPRPDTELLVELALERLPTHGKLLDMGTGSGAIAIAVAHTRRDANVTALDQSSAALAVAQRNAVRHKVDVQLLHSDWYDAVPEKTFNVIVANPPYIREDDIHLQQGDLRFEPISALTDHADGMSALRVISSNASRHLAAGGWLLMEHGYDQSDAVRRLLAEHGFEAVQSWRDIAGIERVSGGKLPDAAQKLMR
jgi:release factor glutamine methyltransferase